MSHAISHIVTCQKWTHPARQAVTRFSYPGVIEGWVDLGGRLHTDMVYLQVYLHLCFHCGLDRKCLMVDQIYVKHFCHCFVPLYDLYAMSWNQFIKNWPKACQVLTTITISRLWCSVRNQLLCELFCLFMILCEVLNYFCSYVFWYMRNTYIYYCSENVETDYSSGAYFLQDCPW